MSAMVGIEKLYAAILTKDDNTGVTYGTPFYLEGVQELQIKPKQSTVKGYAENKTWIQFTSLDDVDVAINVFDISKENQIKLLGQTAATEGGVFAKSSDNPPFVALLYKANTSRAGVYRYGILYKGLFSLNDDSVKGEEGKKNIQSPEFKASFQPLRNNDMWKYHVDTDDADCPTDIETKFFTAVTVPTKKTVA